MTWEAIIKVCVNDEPSRRARDIADGFSYAAALLMDEYGWTALAVTLVLEGVIDEVQDQEAMRA